MKRAPLIIAAFALAACGNNSRLGAQFHKPVAMAVFDGFIHTRLGAGKPSPCLAVVSSAGDELRIVDLVSNTVVPSPGMVFPLSVSTDPLPFKVASASLGDNLADLLVVASVGKLALQVVQTWDSASGAMIVMPAQVDLSAALGSASAGTSVLSLLGLPLAAGTARILVGVTGGKLLVVDFTRDPGGSGAIIPPDPASIAVKTLGFDPVDLAYDVADSTVVYAATRDLITDSDAHAGFQTFGVAAIKTTADATQTWPIQALKAGPASSAGAPTRLVAAATLAERQPDHPEHFLPPARRVYAALDEGEAAGSGGQSWGCGLNHDLSCGIVTIDPALDPTTGRSTNLADDPATGYQPAGGVPAQSYRAPFVLPAAPLAMAITLPPSSGGQRCVPPRIGGTDSSAGNCPLDPNDSTKDLLQADAGTAFLPLAASSGQRWTTAAMVVAAGDGNPYIVDLGRMAVADDVSLLNSDNTRTKVSTAVSLVPLPSKDLVQPSVDHFGLGLHTDVTGSGSVADSVTSDSSLLASAIWVTPGYTPAALWTITHHGSLPGLVTRTATIANDGTDIWVALQNQGTPPQSLGDIVDPALGVQVGDYVDIVQPSAGACAGHLNSNGQGQGRGRVTAILAPDAARPGGALQLAELDADDSERQDGLGSNCAFPSAGTTSTVIITVRTSGLVLMGAGTTYGGRPAFDVAYSFRWQDEAPLVALCPDSPEAAHRSAWSTNRAACESLAIARRARRFYYPEELCSIGQACQTNGWYPNFIDGNALTTGPVVEFRVGAYPVGEAPAIGSYVAFNTLSGLVPMARGMTSPTVPSAALAYDRTRVPTEFNPSAPGDVPAFYVAFVSDELVVIPPGSSAADIYVMR